MHLGSSQRVHTVSRSGVSLGGSSIDKPTGPGGGHYYPAHGHDGSSPATGGGIGGGIGTHLPQVLGLDRSGAAKARYQEEELEEFWRKLIKELFTRFMKWYYREILPGNMKWLDDLIPCPKRLTAYRVPKTVVGEVVSSMRSLATILLTAASPDLLFKTIHKLDPKVWERELYPVHAVFHPGSDKCFREKSPKGKSGQQCCYDENGRLLRKGKAAGTPDRVSPATSTEQHFEADVRPFNDALLLDLIFDTTVFTGLYRIARPPSQGK